MAEPHRNRTRQITVGNDRTGRVRIGGGARVSVRHCRELSGAAELDDVVLVDDGEAVVGWLPRADMDELDNELRTLFDSPQDERQDDTDLELDDDDF